MPPAIASESSRSTGTEVCLSADRPDAIDDDSLAAARLSVLHAIETSQTALIAMLVLPKNADHPEIPKVFALFCRERKYRKRYA